MGAPADHLPFVKDKDFVHRQDGGHPLGDHNRGGAAVMLPDGPAQRRVRPVIQGGGGIVQDQDFRIRGQRPGNQQALLLAAGEIGAVDGGLVVVVIGIILYEFPGHGILRGAAKRRVGDLPPEGDVFPDGIRKENVILEHHAELPVKGIPVVGTDVLSVHENMPLLRIVKAHQQVDNAGFSAAGGSDDAQASAPFDPEGDLFQALLPLFPQELAVRFPGAVRVIAEGNPVKNQHIAGGCRSSPVFRQGCQILGQIHRPGDPVRGGVGLGHHHEDAVQAHDPHENHIEIGEKGENHARGGEPVVHPAGADQHHQGQADIQEERHDRPGEAHDDAGLHLLPGHGGIGFAVPPHFPGLPAQGLDNTNSGNVFPHDAHQRIHPPLYPVIERNSLPGNEGDQQDHDGRHDAENHGQPRVHCQGDGDASQQHDGRPDAHGLNHADETLDIVGVAGHAGDQGRQADLIHLTAGEVQRRVKQIPAEAEGAVPGDTDAHPVGRHVQETGGQREKQHDAAPGHHGPGALC